MEKLHGQLHLFMIFAQPQQKPTALVTEKKETKPVNPNIKYAVMAEL